VTADRDRFEMDDPSVEDSSGNEILFAGNEILFAGSEAVPSPSAMGEAWKVLLVDDESDVHAVLHLALRDVVVDGRPLHLLDARSAGEAKAILLAHRSCLRTGTWR